ncbi:dipeptide epimerase [Kitasatospora sp. NPDC097643]|uniref:dipeptide epimerase n=1 Tax=Kitasatospora sp. NPDC097643 TaxID=3157230 RepID=UPI00332D8CBC
MELVLHEVDLPLRHPFGTVHATVAVQQSLIVELRDGEHRGFGEAAGFTFFGLSLSDVRGSLERARSAIEADRVDDPAAFWSRVSKLLDNSFSLCALDQAAHDLWGKRLGAPVWRLWGLTADRLPVSDYSIGIDTVDRMVAKMNEFPGWPVYKIKLGTPDDIEIVRALRRHTDAVFRVDANTGWTAEQTIRNSAELRKLGVEFIEQPLPVEQWEEQRQVHRESELPVVADESCLTEDDVERCAEVFHGVNIKLAKCGGLTPARRMIAKARESGLTVMAGCMAESTVGISAIAQLLPLLDHADLDGALLLARDVADGVRLDRGRAVLPAENGTGVTWLGAGVPS